MQRMAEPASAREGFWPAAWLAGWVLCMAAGAPALSAAAASGLAACSFLKLWRTEAPRARLQCGLALPLLLLTGGGALAVALWLVIASVAASLRHRGWTTRLASLLTLVFPALLLLASRAYIDWLGYGWMLPL